MNKDESQIILNTSLTMGVIARIQINQQKKPINNSCYAKRKQLFLFYGLTYNDVIGKEWSEIGFIFSKNQSPEIEDFSYHVE